jgi:hypothetical protein
VAVSTFVVVRLALLAAVVAVGLLHRRSPALARNLMVPLAIVTVLLTIRDVFSTQIVPLKSQPAPDAQHYAEGANNMAEGKGYFVSGSKPELVRPRYPPGFSVALLPFAASRFTNFPDDVQAGATTYMALYVLISFITAWRIGGSVAAGLTAILLDIAPFTRQMAGLIMSDPLGATLTVATVLVLSTRETRARAIVAGILSGMSVLVRTALVTNIAALVVAVRRHRIAALISAAAFVGILALYQWHAFGSPFKTSYDVFADDAFHLKWMFQTPATLSDGPYIVRDLMNGRLLQFVCPCPPGGPQSALPNILFYPAMLFGLFWTISPPLLNAVGLYGLIRRRREPTARFTFLVIASQLLLLSTYFYQATRFIAAPTTLLLIFSTAEIARWMIGSSRQSGERL